MAAPPPMPGFMTPMGQMGAPMGMPMKHLGDPSEDEPANKKMRNEDSLIPEDIFIARNTVCIYIFFVLKPFTDF